MTAQVGSVTRSQTKALHQTHNHPIRKAKTLNNKTVTQIIDTRKTSDKTNIPAPSKLDRWVIIDYRNFMSSATKSYTISRDNARVAIKIDLSPNFTGLYDKVRISEYDDQTYSAFAHAGFTAAAITLHSLWKAKLIENNPVKFEDCKAYFSTWLQPWDENNNSQNAHICKISPHYSGHIELILGDTSLNRQSFEKKVNAAMKKITTPV